MENKGTEIMVQGIKKYCGIKRRPSQVHRDWYQNTGSRELSGKKWVAKVGLPLFVWKIK